MSRIKTALSLMILALVLACGKVGPQGIDGRPGADGAPGLKGEMGVSGQDARPCTVLPTADGAQIVCPDGSVQAIHSGQDGAAGTPGTLTSTVQFCPSYGPTTYPNNFPEYGLCIANQLYAVYWTGSQAFLALVPPGRYSSTSTQACSFQVLPNCQVSP